MSPKSLAREETSRDPKPMPLLHTRPPPIVAVTVCVAVRFTAVSSSLSTAAVDTPVMENEPQRVIFRMAGEE